MDNHIKFFSNAKQPYNKLSNFAFIEGGIEFKDIIYPSSEHALQAQKYIESQRERFSMEGDLGSWEGLKLVFKEEDYDKKYKYWGKKNNIGIIAKMATNPKIAKKLGLISDETFQDTYEMRRSILIKQFSIKEFGDILRSTKDYYLLQFDRGSKRRSEKGNAPFWTGLIKDGVLYGENMMGKYLMEIRKELFKE